MMNGKNVIVLTLPGMEQTNIMNKTSKHFRTSKTKNTHNNNCMLLNRKVPIAFEPKINWFSKSSMPYGGHAIG